MHANHRANSGPERQEQRQQREAVEAIETVDVGWIAETGKVSVLHVAGRRALAAVAQIHHQEREIVEDVDGRNRLVELDGIEQARLALPQHHVGEMQVAVDAADETGACARAEQRLSPGDLSLERRRQSCDVGGRHIVRPGLGQRCDDRCRDCAGLTNRIGAMRHGPPGMCDRHGIGDPACEVGADGTAIGDSAQQLALGEPAHADRPLDDTAPSGNGKATGVVRGDRHDVEINFRRRRLVDLEFASTGAFAQGERRQVHVREMDGLLDFERKLASQKDHRAMGLDPLDPIGSRMVGARVRQEGQHAVVVTAVAVGSQ